jgi:hypothetical protein
MKTEHVPSLDCCKKLGIFAPDERDVDGEVDILRRKKDITCWGIPRRVLPLLREAGTMDNYEVE